MFAVNCPFKNSKSGWCLVRSSGQLLPPSDPSPPLCVLPRGPHLLLPSFWQAPCSCSTISLFPVGSASLHQSGVLLAPNRTWIWKAVCPPPLSSLPPPSTLSTVSIPLPLSAEPFRAGMTVLPSLSECQSNPDQYTLGSSPPLWMKSTRSAACVNASVSPLLRNIDISAWRQFAIFLFISPFLHKFRINPASLSRSWLGFFVLCVYTAWSNCIYIFCYFEHFFHFNLEVNIVLNYIFKYLELALTLQTTCF